MVKLEQHMLADTRAHADLLRRLDLRGRHVLEFGAGTGVLTRLLLAEGAYVHAYEIEAALCRVRHRRLRVFEADCRTAVPGAFSALISAPPYELLDWIRGWVERYKVDDVVLLIPARASENFADYEVAATLSGACFAPQSKGEHLLIWKGFRNGQ